MSKDILIVDDEDDIRNLITGILEDEGYAPREAATSKSAYEAIEKRTPSLIILDIWLQGSEHDGLEILRTVKAQHPYLPILMISGHGTIETAVSAIKDGAYDFIEKPFKSDRLLLMIKRALETAALKRENEALKKQRNEISRELIGRTTAIQEVRKTIERAAPTNSRILLTGEPGTGKDVVAQLIHKASDRSDQAYLVLNCANLEPEKLEETLFGTAQGGENQKGFLEQAHGGTLLLDQVSDMPLETQGKIMRVLQEQRFKKVGGQQEIEVDVRILAATNSDLETLVEQGSFRQDLYYRLNVVPITMPPLRKRKDDLEELSQHLAKELTSMPLKFSKKAFEVMRQYEWPGNIRQLRNVVEWLHIMSAQKQGQSIDVEDLPPEISQCGITAIMDGHSAHIYDGAQDLPLREARELFERAYLQSQIDRFDGNISQTAKFVGMERSALHRKLKSLDILSTSNTEDTKRMSA